MTPVPSSENSIDHSESLSEGDVSGAESSYEPTAEDKAIAENDLLDDDDYDDIREKGRNGKRKKPKPTNHQTKRARKEPERFGSTNAENYDAFFENIPNKTISDTGHCDVTHNKDNGSLASTSKCVENDNDFKRLMLAKIGAIEDFLIKIDVKLDNLRQNNRTTNQKKSTNEIDIGLLKALGLPAESESDVEKLEENLKNDEFRLKLTEIVDNLDDGYISGDQALERLTHYLISPSFLPQISWTGRGKGKERKMSLSACDHIINYLVITVNKIDSKFNRKKIVKLLTYDILKRAPTKYGKPKTSDQITASAPVVHSEKAANLAGESSGALVMAQTTPSVPVSPQTIATSSQVANHTPNQNYTHEQMKQFMQHQVLPPMSWWDSRYNPFVHSTPLSIPNTNINHKSM